MKNRPFVLWIGGRLDWKKNVSFLDMSKNDMFLVISIKSIKMVDLKPNF